MESHMSTSLAISTIRNVRRPELEVSAVRVHLFEWNPLSLGWYESLLWSFVFATEMVSSKGAPSVWKGTAIKLFTVREVAAQGPSLLSPQGAVDAVGSNLVKRIGNLNLRSATSTLQRTSSGAVIRDV